MDLSKYVALFLAESREHLSACNQSLLAWERDPAAVEPVDRVFRAIHTIKGMAGTRGYRGLAQWAHGTKTLLDALQKSRVPATPAVFQLLFRAVDTLGRGVEEVAAGAEGEADQELIAELDTASTRQVDAVAAAVLVESPATTPMPGEPQVRR